MCFHYTHIYTSKHSSQHSGRQEFIVAVTLLLLSDIVSKHVSISFCLFFLVAPNLGGEIMFVKCHGVRLVSQGDVLSGRYGVRALCLKWIAVLVFPGGLGIVEWL